LSNYLIVLILLKRHDIPQVFGSTSTHYLIKDHIMLYLHIGPINPLKNCHRLRYNLIFVSQLVDADLDVLFHKSSSRILDSSSNLVCGISHIGKVFQADFSFAQSSVKCLMS
jgi:hypothetical protein